jgi:hypothetical protein
MAADYRNEFTNDKRESWVELNAHDYFLTYSRCPIPFLKYHNQLEKCITKRLGENKINFIVVKREEHTEANGYDTTQHLHVYVRFKNKLHIKSPKFFKMLWNNIEYKPFIDTVTNPVGCMKYTVGLHEKKGNFYDVTNIYAKGVNPLDFINDKSGANTPTSNKSIDISDINNYQSGASSSNIINNINNVIDNNSKSMNKNNTKNIKKPNRINHNAIKEDLYKKLIEKEITINEAVKKFPLLLDKVTSLERNLNRYIKLEEQSNYTPLELKEFKINNLQLKWEGYKKCPQYWVCGLSNTGKNYFIEKLKEKGHKMYLISKTDNNKNYKDGVYSGAYIDEFNRSCLTYDFLNEFLQGYEMELNYKGGSTTKNDHFPIFILSNKFPWEIYKKQDKIIDTILNRMNIIYTYKEQSEYKAANVWNPELLDTNYPNMDYDVYHFAKEFKLNKYQVLEAFYEKSDNDNVMDEIIEDQIINNINRFRNKNIYNSTYTKKAEKRPFNDNITEICDSESFDINTTVEYNKFGFNLWKEAKKKLKPNL